jgi:two-component system response regulator HydG
MEHASITSNSSDSARGKNPVRILLVDDNPTTVKLALYFFKQAGWDAHGHTSPVKALKDLHTFEPDLIVTDFRMVEMNGPEFLLAAEQLHPATPSLVMTAYDDDPAVQSVLRKASVPSVSKTKGLTRIVEIATELISVRKAVKQKALAAYADS